MSIQLIQQYYSKVEQVIRYDDPRLPFYEDFSHWGKLMRVCRVSVKTVKIIG